MGEGAARAGPPQTPFLAAEGRGNIGLLLSRVAKEANSVALHPFSKAKTNRDACFYLRFFVVKLATFRTPFARDGTAGQSSKSKSAVLYC